jgi:hypothetical protein
MMKQKEDAGKDLAVRNDSMPPKQKANEVFFNRDTFQNINNN